MSKYEKSIMDLVRLTRDDSKQVPLYLVQGSFYCKTGETLRLSGVIPEDYKKWGFDLSGWIGLLQAELEKDFGRIAYRAVNGEKLEQILRTGSDVPEKGVHDTTYAAFGLDKALEFGYSATQQESLLTQEICVILYDPSGLQTCKEHYEAIFLKEPITILKGILLIKPNNPQTP